MQRIALQFDYSDKDLVDFIASSAPPEGVAVSKPMPLIKASGSSGGIFYQVVLSTAKSITSKVVGIVASWLYEKIKERGHKKGRVNGKQITYSKYTISLVIKTELKNDRERNAQNRNNKRRSTKKR